MAAHCERCRVERAEVTQELVRTQSVRVLECPECGQKMRWGPLPPAPPDVERLESLERAHKSIMDKLAEVDPWPTIRAKEDRLKELAQAQVTATATLPPEDLEGLANDPLGTIESERATVAKAQEQRQALETEAAEVEGQLAELRKAATYHDVEALRKRAAKRSPGEAELEKQLSAWVDKYADKIRTEHDGIMAEARRLGVRDVNPPSVQSVIRAALARVDLG